MAKTNKEQPKVTTFKIKGNEHELKLGFKGITHLSNLLEGGTYELVGKAMMGNLETYKELMYAGLIHTGENFTPQDVEEAIEQGIEDGSIDMSAINKVMFEFLLNHQFYKATVEMLLKQTGTDKDAIFKALQG